MDETAVDLKAFYIAFGVAILLSIGANLDLSPAIIGLAGWCKEVLDENLGKRSFESLIYISFLLIGLSGYLHAGRYLEEKNRLKTLTTWSFGSLQVVSGLLLGWAYVTVVTEYVASGFQNILKLYGLLSLFTLFVLIPLYSGAMWLSEIKERRSMFSFSRTIKYPRFFRYYSLLFFALGLYGFYTIFSAST